MTSSDRGRLLAARELLVLDLADATLVTLLTSLELEHPTLVEPSLSRAPPTLRRARSLVRGAQRLRDDIERYRHAVDAALSEPDDDLPF
jgi:hypothetical protein